MGDGARWDCGARSGGSARWDGGARWGDGARSGGGLERRRRMLCTVQYVLYAVLFCNKIQTSTYKAFSQLEPFADRPSFLV